MIKQSQDNPLLDEFQQFLQQTSLDSGEFFNPSKQPDLHTLLSEITGLKTEVKAESRQFKQTLDTLSTALSEVQSSKQKLADELDLTCYQLAQQKNELMHRVLLDWIDIYDRLTCSLEILENYRPVKKPFKKSVTRDIHFIESFRQGQIMMLKRFDALLNHYQARGINCLGEQFDPTTMIAVETEANRQYANGVVLKELRKGFYFQNQVLRLAEVKVNKII